MSRFSIIVLLTLLQVTTLVAQTVSVRQEARLYAEPDERAAVRATVPIGVRLTVVADQDGWLAVSSPSGIAGWVLRSMVSEIDESDVVEDVEEAPETDQSEVAEAEPSETESPGDEAGAEPPIQTVATEQTDVPEPARQPDIARSRAIGPGGFYGLNRWWGLSVGSMNDAILPGATIGLMVHRLVAVSVLGLAGYNDTSAGTYYSGGGGLAMEVFGLQPNDRLPLGAFVGGRATYSQTVNSDFESLGGVMTLAGDLGAYAHFGDNVLAIPKAAIRVAQNSVYVDGNKIGDDTDTSFLVGLDVRFGAIVPGFQVIFFDGGEMYTASLLFAL